MREGGEEEEEEEEEEGSITFNRMVHLLCICMAYLHVPTYCPQSGIGRYYVVSQLVLSLLTIPPPPPSRLVVLPSLFYDWRIP